MDPSSEPLSFSEFPEDVQLCILSFLSLPEIAAFACTSKRSLSLCSADSKLWHALCDRRWGSKTLISQWGEGKISFKRLYRTLNEWDSLIGFWRRSGQSSPSSAAASPPLLVFFEWGPTFLAGSRVSPSRDSTYGVVKSPFLWLSLSRRGEAVNFLDPDGKRSGFLPNETVQDGNLLPVNVSFMGASHLVVEENVLGLGRSRIGVRRSSSSVNLASDEEEVSGAVDNNRMSGSLPDRGMLEMYQYFANRTSPGGNGNSRRQRKKEKERQGRRKWEPEHFIKIVNCSPTSSRPLQGLWKGIGDDTKLDFYLVTYDDIGGIACRRVGNSPVERFSSCPLVFWTSNSNYLKTPFCSKELIRYESRVHLTVEDNSCYFLENDAVAVSHILYINSSFDLLIPGAAENAPVNSRHVGGRIWQYKDGTFGFGFLRDNFITDLKHIARNGQLLETEQPHEK